jgi:hypothetical protein
MSLIGSLVHLDLSVLTSLAFHQQASSFEIIATMEIDQKTQDHSWRLDRPRSIRGQRDGIEPAKPASINSGLYLCLYQARALPLNSVVACTKPVHCPFYDGHPRLKVQTDSRLPEFTPMARFLNEPSHKFGVAFVRPVVEYHIALVLGRVDDEELGVFNSGVKLDVGVDIAFLKAMRGPDRKKRMIEIKRLEAHTCSIFLNNVEQCHPFEIFLHQRDSLPTHQIENIALSNQPEAVFIGSQDERYFSAKEDRQ